MVFLMFSMLDTTFVVGGSGILKIEGEALYVSITSWDGRGVRLVSGEDYRVFLGRNKGINTLRLESSSCRTVNLFLFKLPDCTGMDSVVVYVPKSIRHLSVRASTGEIIIRNLNAGRLSVDMGAGLVRVSDSRVDTLNLDVSVGEVGLMNSRMDYLDLNASIGDVYMSGGYADVLNTHLSIGSVNATDFEVGDKRVKIFLGSETWR